VVSDIGHYRVLNGNYIPTPNAAPADVVVGQPDITTATPNNGYTADSTGKQTPVLCKDSIGTDVNGNPTYSRRCNATLDFPRFALPAGNRLFVAAGGNDRVLVLENLPSQNGVLADEVIVQIGGTVNQATDG